MTCPDLGLWRAWLDRELPDDTVDLAGHVAACWECRLRVDDLRQAANLAAGALDRLAPTALPLAAVARERLGREQQPALAGRSLVAQSMGQSLEGPIVTRTNRLTHWRAALAGLAAMVMLTLVVATPAGQAAASQFLAQFRSQRFTAVTVDLARGSHPFADLERLGTVKGAGPAGRGADEVRSLAEAGRRVGFAVKQPDPGSLPAGLDKEPRIQVSPASEMRFTFDKAKARAHFDQTGQPGVRLPDRFDGVSLVTAVPAAVLLEYRGAERGPSLVIGQARELAVGVDGKVTLEELREFLLGLPNLPPEVTRQLREIQDWRRTLPVFVPEGVKWQETTIAGGPGLLLADNSGLGSAAIWQRDGRVYGVAGSIKSSDLLRVANSLR